LLFCCENNFVFMNKIQVKGEEQEVECEKVRDFTDTSFHKYWICSVFTRWISTVSSSKIAQGLGRSKHLHQVIQKIGEYYLTGFRNSTSP
jgi:hypothetical protein